MAGNQGQEIVPDPGIMAVNDLQVRPADARRLNAHQHPAGLDLGHRKVSRLQRLSELAEHHGPRG